MIYNKKGIRILIIIFIILVLVAVSIYFYFKLNKGNQAEPTGLTDTQRIEILDKLNTKVGTKPLTDQEKIDKERRGILKELNTGITTGNSLTESQKVDILNSLNQ